MGNAYILFDRNRSPSDERSLTYTWEQGKRRMPNQYTCAVNPLTYAGLISAEDLCPGAQLVGEVGAELLDQLWIAADVVHVLVEGNVVGGPVASTQNGRLVTTSDIPEKRRDITMVLSLKP